MESYTCKPLSQSVTHLPLTDHAAIGQLFCSLPNRIRARARLEPTPRLSPVPRHPHRHRPRRRRQSVQHEVLREEAGSEQHASSARSPATSDDGRGRPFRRRSIPLRLDFQQTCALDRVRRSVKLSDDVPCEMLTKFQTLHRRRTYRCWLLDDIPSLAQLRHRHVSDVRRKRDSWIDGCQVYSCRCFSALCSAK